MTTFELREWAGPARAPSFEIFVDRIQNHSLAIVVETGSYRGEPGDGQSTRILSHACYDDKSIANCRAFISIDLNADSHFKSVARAKELGYSCYHKLADSVFWLGRYAGHINFLYLDSYDHNPDDPGPCQRHNLAELGAAYGKLAPGALIMIDDCDCPSGGKGLLSTQFLLERRWKIIYDGMQRIFERTLTTY